MKRKFVVIGFAILILCILFIICIFVRTPEYIFSHITPFYEDEAKTFFENNKDRLSSLSICQEAITDDSIYYYTFHEHTFNTTEIPKQIEEILCDIEKTTNNQYVFYVSQREIRVIIESDTYFDVYLYYGPSKQHGLQAHWDQSVALDNGWELHAIYLMRG